MRSRIRLAVWLLLPVCLAWCDERKTATTHPMQYYLSLPDGWSANRTWPVVMIIESAEKEFAETAEKSRSARGRRPYVLATPLVLTNGGPRYRKAPSYAYSDAVWAQAEKAGRCRFDSEGIAAVAADIARLYHGERRYFIAGLEAAGHTVFMQVFSRPEALRAAAVVAPNYQGRCMDELGFSSSPERARLPVRIFGGSKDPMWGPGKPFYTQTAEARRAAAAHGFRDFSETVGPGRGHEFMAAEILDWFDTQ